MENQKLEDVTPEALKEEKAQKSRNRIFGLVVLIDIALLAVLVYEIIMFATRAR